MPNAFTLFGSLKIDTASFEGSLKRADSQLKNTEKSLSKAEAAARRTGRSSASAAGGVDRLARSGSNANKSFALLGSALGRYGSAAVIAIGAYAIKTATDFDSLKRALTSVSGSATNAEAQFARLREVAKSPGLGFKEAIQGSINLQAAGLNAQLAERALSAFGNALATVGKGKAELDGVITALSQIQSKGKVSAEEINQLAERLPQIRVAMKEAFGTADTEALQKMGLSTEAFITKVIAQFERLPKVTDGAKNSFENFGDALEQAILPIGNRINETLIPALQNITKELEKEKPSVGAVANEIGLTIGREIGKGIIKAKESDGGFLSSIRSLAEFSQGGLVPSITKGLLESGGYETSLNGLVSAYKDAYVSIGMWTGKILSTTGTKLGTIPNIIGSLAGPVGIAAANLASSIGQGFINGINAQISAMRAAVSNAMGGVTVEAKATLESHSPSKVFFRIGRDVAQGFIDGIESMKTGMRRAMAAILDISGLNLKFGKTDAEGVTLLGSLIRELDDLTERTRVEGVMAELTAKKYEKLNTEIKKRIVLAAQQLDFQNRFFGERLDSESEGAGSGRAESNPGDLLSSTLSGSGFLDTEVNPFDKLLGLPPGITAAWTNFWATMNERLTYFKASLPSLKQALGENLISSIQGIGDVFANAVMQWDGTAKGFFKSLASGFKQLVSQIVAELVRLMVIKAIMQIIGAVAGGGGGGGSSASSGLGGGLLAGLGGGHAMGGYISGPGSSTSDSIPAMLSNGEYVINAKAVKKWGAGFFEGLNSMRPMAFAGGGLVGGGAPVYNNQNYSSNPVINVYMPQGGGGSNMSREQVERAVTAALLKSQARNK